MKRAMILEKIWINKNIYAENMEMNIKKREKKQKIYKNKKIIILT